MVTLVGASKVAVNVKALENLLNSILPEGKDLDLEVKLDARGNVKSTFMKVENGKGSIYTGAIETEWDVNFASNDNVQTPEAAMVFIATFMVKKALAGVKYDMKLSSMSNIRLEDDFIAVKDLILKLVEKYKAIAETTPDTAPRVATSTKASGDKSASKKATNPNANKPLVNTPEVDIPGDIDLVAGANVPLPEPVPSIDAEGGLDLNNPLA